ncbi:MAG: aminoglycoside phosphotransferase family protein [Acetobacteraceae bacterium]
MTRDAATATRDATIAAFLARHGFAAAQAAPLAQDASFRRYLRLSGGPRPAVLMDAPPPEDVAPFLRIAAHLAALGLSAPGIIAADPAAGLVLEEDLGDALFATRLDRTPCAITLPPDALALFDAAIDTLACLQRAAPPQGLPAWDARAMIAATLDPLFTWWWPAAIGTPAPETARADLAAALAVILAPLDHGPKTFVHRDFFAGNLIHLPDRRGLRQVGILDFQSAAIGHPAYDLVSLVQDARRPLPASLTEHAITRLLAVRPELDPAVFRAAFAACAAQRHLRVATQWVRLARRDHRPHYLVHGPHTWHLLATALNHPVVAPLAAALDRWVPVALRGNPRGGSKQGQGTLPPGPPPGDSRPLHPPPARNQWMRSKGAALGGGPGGSAPWPCLHAPRTSRFPPA